MAVAIIMPRQGQSVESCIITKWHKKVGDEVKEGDLLFSYETDKASFDEEAKASGTLLAILAEEGDDVPVLQNVCVIGRQGEDVSEFTAPGALGNHPKCLIAGRHGNRFLRIDRIYRDCRTPPGAQLTA